MSMRIGIILMLALAGCCTVLLSTSMLYARQAIVTTRDGREIEGELIDKNATTITLKIAGIPTTLDMDKIEHIEVLKDTIEIYYERKAAIDGQNAEERYQLAYFLFENKELEMARLELDQLLKMFPDNEKIQLLSVVINERMKLIEEESEQEKAERKDTLTFEKVESSDETFSTVGAVNRKQLLDDRQIDLIRLWELPADLEEAKPRVLVRRVTIEQLFEQFADERPIVELEQNERAYYLARAPGYERLELIFAVGAVNTKARSLYSQIDVQMDPAVIVEFRQHIHNRYLAGYFWHTYGRDRVEGLNLVRPVNDRAVVYTNFYNLTQYRNGDLPMIDRETPERSLLLQWGLPRDLAMYPGPDVTGWEPFFTGIDDPNFRQYRDWIESLCKNADYGIED